MGKTPFLISDYTFVGLDPGTTGSISVLFSNRKLEPVVFPLENKSTQEIADFLDRIKARKASPFYLLEQVHGSSFAFSGKGRASGAVMFNFGKSVGLLEGLCARHQLQLVSPMKWQKEFGLAGRKKTTTSAKKNTHKAKALQIFPNTHLTQKTADSLLIALYCRQHYRSLF